MEPEGSKQFREVWTSIQQNEERAKQMELRFIRRMEAWEKRWDAAEHKFNAWMEAREKRSETAEKRAEADDQKFKARMEAWEKRTEAAEKRAETDEQKLKVRMEGWEKRMAAAEKRAEADDKKHRARMDRAERKSDADHKQAMERMDKFDVQLQATRKLVEAGMRFVVNLRTDVRALAKSQKAFLDSLRRGNGNGRRYA